MRLRKLPFSEQDGFTGQAQQWFLYAVAKDDGSSSVEDFLNDQLRGDNKSAAEALLALIDSMVYDAKGPQRWIGTKRCHESVAGHKIYEFRQGALRIHWFYGQGRCVAVLAQAVAKQTNKTPKHLAKELIALKSKYEDAAKNGLLRIIQR
jgi:Phage derived protein Gp49-like (DUF891)